MHKFRRRNNETRQLDPVRNN